MLSKLSLLSQPDKKVFSSFDFVDWTPQGIYIDEHLFIPKISRDFSDSFCNTVIISLTDPKDKSVWQIAEKMVEDNKKVIWDLSPYVAFLLGEKPHSSLESVFYHVFSKLEELLQDLANAKPLAVCLASYSLENPHIFFDEQTLYGELSKKTPILPALFRYELFLHFMEQLASLFSGLAVFTAVDFSNASLSTALLLSSKEYFERMHLFSLNFFSQEAFLVEEKGVVSTCFTEGSKPSLAIVLPDTNQGLLEESSLAFIASCLSQKNIPYKVIAEPFLHLEWEGIEQLIVFSSYLTKEGFRKVQGFLAAEGEVVVVGEPLDIAQQTSYEAFLNKL